MIGARIGRYEVLGRLGKGGMGEVYRAVDIELKREVALKVLPPSVAEDPQRLARFQREAELLASLNHPHIAILYGLERSQGTPAIAMELVDGRDLGDRIAQGALPVAEALTLAQQIAEALEAAHHRGIIHRDLKPSNVRVRSDGSVKVLDFGLAKALAHTPHASDASRVTAPAMTEAGMILGTAGYMSPEQARGQFVDTRTDIWAFGCLLFEMLTGRAPFARQTVSDSIAAILEREPDWTTLPASVPTEAVRLVHRCLAKDPQRRLRDIGDARLDLEEALAAPVTGSAAAVRRTRSPWGNAAALLAITAIAALALVTWWLRPPVVTSDTSFPIRFDIGAPSGYDLDVNRSPVGVSPDGRSVAFAAVHGNTQRIYVRELDKIEAVALPGTEGGFAPFFSPDGEWVGFFANQKIRKVLRSGGAAVPIADFSDLAGNRSVSASWDVQDTIFFTPDVAKGIWRVSSTGGTPVEVTTPTPRESFHLWPQLLPGGHALLFSAIAEGPEPQAYVQRLDTGERTPLVRGHGTRYVPSGHLVFVQGGSLMAVPFDPAQLRVTGAPVGLAPDVTAPFRLRTMASGFNRLFDVSPNGTLAFLSAGPAPQHALIAVDRSGQEQPTGASGGTYAQPRLSPDGARIAVVARSDDLDDVWVYERARHTWERFTSDANSGFPLWSLDGSRLVYNTDRSGAVTIESKRADGGGAPETLVSGEFAPRVFPFSWSRDGALAFVALRPAQDIYMVQPNKSPIALIASPFVEGAPMFSPDGRAIAYVSSESGRNEVQLRSFPGLGEKLTVSNTGGNEPLWAPNGRELFYRVGDALMAVDVATTPRLTIGTPHTLFEKPYEPTVALYANYSTIDGKQFIMVKRINERTTPTQIHVVAHWLNELRQRAPTR